MIVIGTIVLYFLKMFGFLQISAEEAERMRELREAIAKYGQGIGQDIVKVDMFLNHRIETVLLFRMGEELASRFRDAKPDLILTVEASGIALALATARAMGDLPVVFAKKGATVVQSPDVAEAKVYSFTHKRENVIRVDKKFLPQGSQGMMALCAQTACSIVGIGIGIEKGFMQGGENLRSMGIRLSSLAVVTGIEDGKLLLADD